MIAEHVGHNAWGHPIVSLCLCLYLYDADGRLFLGPNSIPEFVDLPAAEFVLWKVAAESGYVVLSPPDGHDLYPPCPVCRGAIGPAPVQGRRGRPMPGVPGLGPRGRDEPTRWAVTGSWRGPGRQNPADFDEMSL